MRRWDNAGLLLGQLRRRLANSKPTLGQRLMFAGSGLGSLVFIVSLTLYWHYIIV